MNNDIAIKVEHVSKQYRLGQVGTGTLSQDLNRWWAKMRGKEDPFLRVGETNDRTVAGGSEYVWALRDLNFEIKKGDIVGIIGRNGAGKSTLLKLLSKTTLPTTGEIKINGRIASLLEVGTGFHPDLTGRENIYLNGAILGMTKKEIKRKFDEIVDFAGVARYVDTPVKRYSSGMYVRLAFAVAAHLDPDILIVDEVLAVGDAEFQKKAIGKMQDVSRDGGRTVLFVSHNMAAVRNLCNKSIVMQLGKISFDGDCKSGIDFYKRQQKDALLVSLGERNDRQGTGLVRITEITFWNSENEPISKLTTGHGVRIKCKIKNSLSQGVSLPLRFDLNIFDTNEVFITQLTTYYQGESYLIDDQVREIEFNIPKVPLLPNIYTASVYIKIGGEEADWIENAVEFVVEEGDYFGIGKVMPKGFGLIAHEHSVLLK